jgi:hypothetical protein
MSKIDSFREFRAALTEQTQVPASYFAHVMRRNLERWMLECKTATESVELREVAELLAKRCRQPKLERASLGGSCCLGKAGRLASDRVRLLEL